MNEIYYHGVNLSGELGHYLFRPGMRSVNQHSLPGNFPCRPDALDGGLLPQNKDEIEGRVSWWRTQGWTILAFWDRSGDSRGNSNSAFVIRGEMFIDDALDLAKEAFPEVFARMKFEVELK